MENRSRTRTCATPSKFPSGKARHRSIALRCGWIFGDPTDRRTFVFHCHILLHEDLGMMHKILVEP